MEKTAVIGYFDVVQQFTGLILCEGDTEVRYFRDMVEHLQLRGKLVTDIVDIYQPKDHSPRGLLHEAKKRIAKASEMEWSFQFIWLVFDKDDHPGVAATFHEARNWKGQPAINIAFTATCFEFYILLHFERTTRPSRNCGDTIKHLKKHLPDYEKSATLYKELYKRKYTAYQNCSFLMKQTAVDRERGMQPYEHAAYTNVQELELFLETL